MRLYKLSSYPVSLSWDEVAIGYNAYSIAQTGKDEYGKKFPLLFKSFNDFKLPGYIYTDSIFVKFLGLSEFSVRLPSALFGTIAVALIFIITNELAKNFKLIKFEMTYLSSFLLAISPWHIQVSRAAFEANLALTIVLAGVIALLKGFKSKLSALLSMPILSLSVYFYYSARIFVPVILVVTYFLFRNEISKNLKYFLVSLMLAFLISLPLFSQIATAEGLKRVKEVSIFSQEKLIVDYVKTREIANNNLLADLFLNRRIPTITEALHNYLSHFSFGFLFFGDDPNARHRSAFHGNLYLFELPLILIGLYKLLKFPSHKIKYFLLVWLLVAPIPAAISQDSPHGLRALLMLPMLVILSSIGVYSLAQNFKVKLILVMAILIFFINYLFSYYLLYPQRDNLSWAYGYKQMLTKVSEVENNYERIIVSGYYWKPYIFYLFYHQVDPQYYFTNNQESIGKYRFGTTGWDSGGKDISDEDLDILKLGKTLIAISPIEYNGLQRKGNFQINSKIFDFSSRKEIFLIGEWR